jgi:hypothetical protein
LGAQRSLVHVFDREGNEIRSLDFKNEEEALEAFNHFKEDQQRIYTPPAAFPPIGKLLMTHFKNGQWRTIKHECTLDGLHWITCDHDGDCEFPSDSVQQ